jgi:hypothetical protein
MIWLKNYLLDVKQQFLTYWDILAYYYYLPLQQLLTYWDILTYYYMYLPLQQLLTYWDILAYYYLPLQQFLTYWDQTWSQLLSNVIDYITITLQFS